MRTVKISLSALPTPYGKVTVEVESIIADEDAEEEGGKAHDVLAAFQRGIQRAAEEAE